MKTIRQTKGLAESATDKEIVDAIKLLAKLEGIFSEPAGSVPIAVLRKLLEQGEIAPDERVVCYVTGSGLKTVEAIEGIIQKPIQIEGELKVLTEVIGKKRGSY